MKQEYALVILVVLIIFAQIVSQFVAPLELTLTSPFNYFTTPALTQYPFSSLIIVVRSIALVGTLVWLMSFFERSYFPKAVASFVILGILEIFSYQDVATQTGTLPLDWALVLTLSGISIPFLLLYYLFRSAVSSAHKKLSGENDVSDNPLNDTGDHSQN